MVDAGGHDHQVVLLELDPHPIVVLAADIEVASSVQNIPNLLILVQVLVEEVLDLLLVHVAHGGGRNGDLVAVLVGARGRDGVHIVDVGEVEVQDAEFGEVVVGDGAVGVVGETLVALHWCVSACAAEECGVCTGGGMYREIVEPVCLHDVLNSSLSL